MKQLSKITFMVFIISYISCSHLYAQTTAFKQTLDTLLRHTVKEISPAKAALKKQEIFLDARKLEEFNVSHIAKAIRVGYSDFP